MRYYKIAIDGYIQSVGTGEAGEEINVQEYNDIMHKIKQRPIAPDGYEYHLTESLGWELVAVEMHEEVDTMTETEQKAAAYDILTGVSK